MSNRQNTKIVDAEQMALIPELQAQQEYVRKLEEADFDFSLMVGDAFVRGIRDIGYKHTGTALDELIDNAIQARAKNVHVVFGFNGASQAKPDWIAVIDDGHGMTPSMLRAAVLWGGTHREDNRDGFGRYGYGLPSASISQGHQFTVYSLVQSSALHAVTVDVDAIGKGTYTGPNGRIIIPKPEPAQLPEWVTAYIKEHFKTQQLAHGTVVVIGKLDRLTWSTTRDLQRHLLQHFGVTYRNYLRAVNIFVQGTRVDPIDPLFITPGFRHYDLDEDRAEALEPLTLPVKDSEGKKILGEIHVRFSYMPPTFQRIDKFKETGKKNARFAVMKDHNGLIILRNGRQIDVVTSRCPWTTFINYDRNWGLEIDFPPTLDEEFSITTSKQQVVLSERMWTILREAGVWSAIRQLRKRLREDLATVRVLPEIQDGKRASEVAMEEAEKFKTRRPLPPSLEDQAKIQERLEQEVRKRAREDRRPVEQVLTELLEETQSRPYKVIQESLPGAPFFRVNQLGGQKILALNTGHRFFTDVYVGPESTPRLRAALEIVLFVIGECELEASGDREMFYQIERVQWSTHLNNTLERLDRIHNIEDELSAADEVAETEEVKQSDDPVMAGKP